MGSRATGRRSALDLVDGCHQIDQLLRSFPDGRHDGFHFGRLVALNRAEYNCIFLSQWMVAVAQKVSTIGFVRAITGLLGGLATNLATADLGATMDIADKEFGALERTQSQFLSAFEHLSVAKFKLLDALSVAASTRRSADESLVQKAVDQLQATLETIDRERRIDHPSRRANYEDAKAFRDKPSEYLAILKKVPGDVGFRLAAFMTAFCNYFETDGAYERELGAALGLLEDNLLAIEQKLRDEGGINRRFIEEVGSGMAPISAHGLNYENWPRVSVAYQELRQSIMEYGAIPKQ